MKLTIIEPGANKAFPNGYLEINEARITWPNFKGEADRFNREGDRHFTLIIPDQEIADALLNDKNKFGDGWNVKIKPPREEGDVPFMHMKVKVKFNGRGPAVYLVNGKGDKVRLDEDSIGMLDDIDIVSCDMDIRPYDDQMPNGSTFRTAYLSAMLVHQRVDRFAADDYLDF